MSPQSSVDITNYLRHLRDGDPAAADRILAAVYPTLLGIARAHMRRERKDHTLQPTALLHEAWLRLIDQTRVDWRDRAHFFGVAASMMRRVLVDHARQRLAEKRGAGETPISIEGLDLENGAAKLEEILAVHEALDRLNTFDAQQARIVELRYFGGLDVDETAETLKISPRTVDREWSLARAWLRVQLQPKESQ